MGSGQVLKVEAADAGRHTAHPQTGVRRIEQGHAAVRRFADHEVLGLHAEVPEAGIMNLTCNPASFIAQEFGMLRVL